MRSTSPPSRKGDDQGGGDERGLPLLSAAGAAVAGTKACAGWDVWRIEHGGAAVPLKRLREEAINRGLAKHRLMTLHGPVGAGSLRVT
ncbi:hypothetical protein ACFQX6_27305 [Streptosporangium lutulentum]